MKTGLESLDVGAPEITYSGNQGPKSPQEDQQKMAEFQMQEYMEEFESVFPEMKNQRGTPEYDRDLKEYFQGLASKQSGGIGDMAMKSGLIDEYRNYKMGQEEAGEQFMSPRDYYRSLEQDRMGAAGGGIMRTGFQGGGMDMGNQSNQAQSAATGNSDRGNNQPTGPAEYGSSTAGTDRYPVNIDTSRYTDDIQDQNQRAVVAAAIAENKKIAEQKELEKFIEKENRFVAIKKDIEKIAADKKTKLADVANIKNIKDEEESEDARLDYMSDFEEGRFAKNTPETMNQLKDYRDAMQKSLQPGINPILKKVLDFSGIPFLGAGVESLYNKYYDPFGYGTTKTTPQTTGGGRGDDNMNSYIPPMTMANVAGTGTNTAKKDPASDFTFNFSQQDRDLLKSDLARINKIGAVRAADGGMMREPAAFGGIMGDDGRRAYGLGSIFKKAARAIKKVAKSPVGKVALMYAGGKFLGNLGSFVPGQGEKTGFFNKLLRQKNDEGFYKKFDPFKVGIAGLSAATYLKGKQDEDDELSLDEYMGSASRGPSLNPSGIREYIAANKGRVDPNEYAFLQPNFYAADGGRIGYAGGGVGELRGALSKEMFGYDDEEDEIMKLAFGGSTGLPPVTMMPEGQNTKSFNDDESMTMAQGTTLPNQMPRPKMDPRMMQQMMMAQKQGGMNSMMGNRMMAAMGGRMGYANGGSLSEFEIFKLKNLGYTNADDPIRQQEYGGIDVLKDILRVNRAMGGRMNYAEGGDEGELLDMGGMEKDYRNDGGFVPMGEYERKDDVPARLSKNEFVFTADAVRNAGAGDIDKGAEIMENMMKNLEDGGQVSEDSQGLDGAREMFQTQQRLGEVL